MRLLLVEDDRMLGEVVQAALQAEGHAVDWVRDLPAADAAAALHRYDALLLDLGLPRGDGLSLLRQLRLRDDEVPVIILTARDSIAQRVAGLDAGADDYLLKPFDLDELTARLRAVSRRRLGGGRARPAICVGNVCLDPATKRCTRAGAPVELTGREFSLLLALMQRPGAIVSRHELEDRLFEWGREVESNAVEVYVSQLRRKLGREFIKTRRGLGYSVEAVAA